MITISDTQFKARPKGGLMGPIGGGAEMSYRSGNKAMSVYGRARDDAMRANQAKTGAADSVKARRERLAAERAARGG